MADLDNSFPWALWHMPQTQQENSHDVAPNAAPLELWHQTSHDTQGSTSLSKCKLGFLGEMGTGMAKMGRRSEMAATEATFCFKTQNKEPKNAKGQRQGIRPQGQRWKGTQIFLHLPYHHLHPLHRGPHHGLHRRPLRRYHPAVL